MFSVRHKPMPPMRFSQSMCALLLVCASTMAHAATSAISAGVSHSASLSADGTVRTWGNDSAGQLGVGRSLVSANPVAVRGASGISAIASGDSHVIALKSSGTVLAWGDNDDGQLGDGTATSHSLPVTVAGLADIEKIWSRGAHNFARKRDGTYWGWGKNGSGELGDASYENLLTPAQASDMQGVTELALGAQHTLARKNDGTVWAWGLNDHGQLGDGTRTDPFAGRAAKKQVIGLSGVVAVAAGSDHSLALKSDGTVWAWGGNSGGQIGDGTTIDRLVPVQVSGLSGVAQIVAGSGHSIAVKNDGSVVGWGSNGYAELGDGTYTDRPNTVPLSGLGGVLSISSGFLHTFAVMSGGTLVAWGNNEYGQLGDGTTQQRTLPAPVAGLTGITAVAVGDLHTVALKSDGTVLTWGDNSRGQLGNGTLIFRSTPSTVSLSGIAKIAAGAAHTVALKADGSVLTWGLNCCGQLGDGTNNNRSLPLTVAGIGGNVQEISAGALHTLALRTDGIIVAWGYNYSGQLGDRAIEDVNVPSPVLGLSNVAEISAGANHSLARKNDGTVWAWGQNDSGQLGNGTLIDGHTGRTTPVAVSALNGVRAISAGDSHSLALKTDGTVWAWGSNGGGRLGDGTIVDRLVPVQVRGLTNIIAIAAANVHSLALKGDGTVWAWGSNYGYQLGDGTGDEHILPVQVVDLSGVVAIAANSHALALKGDGTVVAWGGNNNGQLGDGTLVDRARPVVVVRENGAGSIAANNWYLDLNPAISKTVAAERTPVFLAVTTGAAADVMANIQFRAADVGTNGNVYVFALAPANLVKNVSASVLASHKGVMTRGSNKDTPLPCVLAQLTASGQLTAVSASSLQAYLSGVLSSQGASVSVLNGVSTALLSGSVFYVGYGSNSASMISGGTNRSVVAVPGVKNCQPQAPQTGWWWNPNESGRGFGIEVRGNSMFMSGYLYDETGHATWVVSPGPVALDGSFFNGPLYKVANGQTLTGTYKPAAATAIGTITISFTDARNGTLIFPGGSSIPIQRFDDVIGSGGGTTPSFVPETGWWWNADESGRGFFVEIKNNYAFIAGYMYEANGDPVWYLTQNAMSTPQMFSSVWQQIANGQTLTGPYKPASISNANVGPVAIQFQDATHGVLTLPGGRQLAITRQLF
ncbi:MAG: hypothetical protein ABI905_04165 [Betaproteobacteria bacterium]